MMDRRSWLWRRRSSEKSPGESESSGSLSSHSERYSDDQEGLRASPNDTSGSHDQLPEDSSNTNDAELYKTVKGLNEKLSAALLNISAKEDLVKQHAKVSEEAIAGWEQAETEVAALKQQLEAAVQKNSSLEDKINQLDGAPKECVRQLRQSRQEQEEKVSINSRMHELEPDKHETETQLVEAKPQFEATSLDDGLKERLEAVEKENLALKIDLQSRSKDLHGLLVERDISTKAAETASKQHLESIKRITKLEAECCQLRNINRRLSSASNQKPIASSVFAESLADSQSESGEHLFGINGEPGCSDSWASALISDVDQSNSKKANSRNLTTSIEIEFMDDFLEMERFVALPEADNSSSGFEQKANSDRIIMRDNLPKVKNETIDHKSIELEAEIERLEHEREEFEIALAESCNQLNASCDQLTAAENKIIELQMKVDMSDELRMTELMDLECKCKDLERKLESASLEKETLTKNISLLEENCEAERQLSVGLKDKIEIIKAARQALDSQLKSAHLEISSLNERIVECQTKEGTLFSELTAKVEALEATRVTLESQLEHAHSEHTKLQEVVSFWEQKAQEEMILSAEFAIKLEAAEVAKNKLELDLRSVHKFTAEIDATKAAKRLLEVQLKSANGEVKKLTDKVALLERKIDEERTLSAELATRCRKLEGDLLQINQEAERWRVTNLNRELKIKQEKELAVAAGKLEECQKTIASLNRQLKLLTTLDDLMLDPTTLGHNLGMLDGNGSTSEAKGFHCNEASEVVICNATSGRERSLPQTSSVSFLSSSSSNMSGFIRTLSRTKSTAC